MTSALPEFESDRRFAFGANWERFLRVLSEERIAEAERSLKAMLGVERLDGRSLLDVGCGSGLFSLAARRLGGRVRSFDYDPKSVGCAQALRARYFPEDPQWVIGQGSVLDEPFIRSLGRYDVVYSWGVLHHTGAMWKALDMVLQPLQRPGQLFIAVYNQQAFWSRYYATLKRLYGRSPAGGQAVIAGGYAAAQVTKGLVRDLLSRRNPLTRYREKIRDRGMSMWHDWVDWIGGYPFEVARPEEILDFYRRRGLRLERLKTCGGGQGCNEYVFRRSERGGND
jgi:SAM-dependent methyltransferase